MPIIPSNNVEIQDEGVVAGYVRSIDFAGAGVSASVLGHVATVTIPGGSGSGSLPFATGDFTVPTGEFRIHAGELILTGTETATVEGNGLLVNI